MAAVPQGKFLIDWMQRIDRIQLFFIVWFVLIGPFAWMVWSGYRRATRRNFSSDPNAAPDYMKKRFGHATGKAVANSPPAKPSATSAPKKR